MLERVFSSVQLGGQTDRLIRAALPMSDIFDIDRDASVVGLHCKKE